MPSQYAHPIAHVTSGIGTKGIQFKISTRAPAAVFGLLPVSPAACFYRHPTVLHATRTVSTYSSHFLFRLLGFISAPTRSSPLYPTTLPYTHSSILSCSHSRVYRPLVPASYIHQACTPEAFFTCRGNDIYPCSTLTSSCLPVQDVRKHKPANVIFELRTTRRRAQSYGYQVQPTPRNFSSSWKKDPCGQLDCGFLVICQLAG